MSKKYDYLVVGAGLYGAVFAHEAKEAGKSVLVIDKRPNIAGNVFTEDVEGIHVHKYGAHIFHTNNKKVWNYITRFAEFNRFTNSPVANYHGELYSLPFNMYTFNKMWGVVTPEEAAAKIEEQKKEAGIAEPKNLEEQAISLVGRDIFEKLIKGYTEKQWGRDCKDLPSFIIKRLPVRLTFDNNYFNALYQGIPVGGYTKMVANMLDGVEVRLGEDYLEKKAEYDALAEKIIYTGPIDAYFDYQMGYLEYRSVRFETELLDKPNFQGNAAVNYTDRETPWTRIIEHKWFEFGKDDEGNDLPKTVISREYSSEWKPGDEPYYPVNDEKNGALYSKYRELAQKEKKVVLLEALEQAKEPTLPELLFRYLEQRSGERADWTSRGKLKGTVADYNKVQAAMDFLRKKGISTVESLDTRLDEISKTAVSVMWSMKKSEKRIKTINTMLSYIDKYEAAKPVHAEYAAIGWKKKKEKFAESHREELDAYNAAVRYLKVNLKGNSYSRKDLESEREQLAAALPGQKKELEAVQADVKVLRDVRHWLNQVLPSEQYRQTAEPGKKPSVQESLKGRQERIRQEQTEKQKQPRTQKQQDMEL